MAIWQFSCFIIPKKNSTKNIPLDCEDILSWEKDNKTIENIEKISFLEKRKSWSNKISQYGNENGTCIEFFYENNTIKEISCRLDLRSLSKSMLREICNYIEEINGMILYNNAVYSPDFGNMVELLKGSSANLFIQDPRKYIEQLQGY